MRLPGRRIAQLLLDRSIFTKLIVSLLIVVTPLYVFNYVITSIGAENNRKEIERAVTSSLDSYDNLINAEFQRINQMLKESALDTALRHLDLVKDDISYVEKRIFLNETGSYLSKIFYSTRFLSDVTIHLPILNISNSVIGGSKPYDAEALHALRKQGSPFINWNGHLYMNVPYLPTLPGYDGLFVIAAELSQETLSAYLSKIVSFSRSGAILFDSEDRWSVSSTESEASVGEEIKSRLLARIGDFSPYASEPLIVSETIDDERYLIAFEPSSDSDAILAAYAPEAEIFSSLAIYKKFFYSISLLSILIIVLFAFGLYKLIHKPLRMLVQAFRKVELGQLHFSLIHRNKDEFGYLYSRFNTMTETLDNLVNVVYEQKLLNERSELKRLQSQINPHFLYNNFFILKRLIRSGNKDMATQFADYLGRYFQFITRNASDEVTLEEDAQHAKAYVDIQSVCFDQRVSISFEPVPEEIRALLVPRLLMQPLIENCFHHVFERQLSHGKLSISFQVDEQAVRINIDDNGKEMNDEALAALEARLERGLRNTEESTGIINVHRRLRLKFGEKSGLVPSRSELGGMRMQIVIHREEGMPDA